MKIIHITREQTVRVEFVFGNSAQYFNFAESFRKACKMDNDHDSVISLDDATGKITFEGRMDTLSHAWFLAGAIAERSTSVLNRFKKLILN